MEEIKELIKKVNDWLDKTFSPNGKKVFIAVVLLIISSLVYLSVVLFQDKNNNSKLNNTNLQTSEMSDRTSQMQDEDIDLVDIEISEPDVMVTLSVEDTGRSDPFLPANEAPIPTINTNYRGYDLMAPPDQVTYDPEASQVVKTKVSGILYDNIRPSAILNISGSDYLVRPSDYINGYKVLSITKDLVTVQLGKNIYKAHVGEVMNNSPINQNTVYDLEHRFGGAKR